MADDLVPYESLRARNYYTDNRDLRFHLEQMVDWAAILKLKEDIGSEECPYASVDEAVQTYLDMMKDPIGSLAAERIAPRAEEVDLEGCRLRDGEVELPPGLRRNLQDLKDAQLMGLPVPRKYGGLQFPETIYIAATEIMSRADASLMNFFGLQGGIAETIHAFASEELKDRYLPGLCSGELTGAMALTEPDAGSDLAAVQTRASIDAMQDPVTGAWTVSGTKRFITNGCGDVILVLARSEDPKKYAGGRGLSFFLVEKGERVQIRRLENKLGIHGSPTCEVHFDGAPAHLIGHRGHGLARYTAWLMLAARLAVSAQAVGISEAALREAKRYAEQREQFGKKIKEFAQVAAMLVEMEVYTEAARALLYFTCEIVDLNQGAEDRELVEESRKYGRLASVLTPLTKYYSAELANRITYDAIQVHGGSGYMKEYPVERLYRDARITNIYEGTSQIQVGWSIAGILKGYLDETLDTLTARTPSDPALHALWGELVEARGSLRAVVELVKGKDAAYRDLVARNVVDMVIDVLVAALLLSHAERWDRKKIVARKFIRDALPRFRMNREHALKAEPVPLAALEA